MFLYCNPVGMSALWHIERFLLCSAIRVITQTVSVATLTDFRLFLQLVYKKSFVLVPTESYVISAKMDFKLIWKTTAIFFSFLNIDCFSPEQLEMVSLPTSLDFLCSIELVQGLRLPLCQDE